MNKSKNQLIEENKKLREIIENYGDFWEHDMSKSLLKKIANIKKIMILVFTLLLCFACFLMGLNW